VGILSVWAEADVGGGYLTGTLLFFVDTFRVIFSRGIFLRCTVSLLIGMHTEYITFYVRDV
jgi:hypothetical protein